MSFTEVIYISKDVLRLIGHNFFKGDFKYSYNNKGCKKILVLGNGPSASQHLEALDKRVNTDIFALNDFSISPFFQKIKPNYYVFLDPCYWLSPEKTNSFDVQMREKVMDSISRNVSWEMRVFIPKNVHKKRLIPALYTNKNIRIVTYDDFYISLRDNAFFYSCLKKNLATPFNNVLAAAIYLAVNMGYMQIGILGADHSWTIDLRVNESNEVCTVKRHFFDEEETLVPWYTSMGSPYKMSKILEDLRKTFLSYELLSKYAESFNVRIVNCSKGSFIDSFDRQGFNDFFEE